MANLSAYRKAYITSDATVVVDDLPTDVVAYGADGRLVGSFYNTVLYSDEFGATANLGGRVPDTRYYAETWVSASLQTGQQGGLGDFVVFHLTGSPQTGHLECNSADVLMYWSISCDSGQSAQVGAMLRYVDASNYLLAVIRDTNTANPVMEIVKVIAGTPTVVQSNTLTGIGPISIDVRYECSLSCIGNDISWTITISATDYTVSTTGLTDHNTATKHGVYVGAQQIYVGWCEIRYGGA